MRRAAARIHGVDLVERAVAAMRPDARADFTSGFDTAAWYPVTHVDAFYDSLLREAGGGIDAVRLVAQRAMEDDIGTFYRLILRTFDPSSVLNFGLRVWRTIYDAGQVTVERPAAGRVLVNVDGVEGFTRHVWYDVLGGVEGMVAFSRATDKSVRIVEGGDDGPRMKLEVSWSPKGS
ncbi:MAG: hypothetical protein HYY06_12935 [Deltaproteobacteria bacterium]|nr:hypothetical protein [Deltaproteobacteria bacterium]